MFHLPPQQSRFAAADTLAGGNSDSRPGDTPPGAEIGRAPEAAIGRVVQDRGGVPGGWGSPPGTVEQGSKGAEPLGREYH